MTQPITWVGIDDHKLSLTVAVVRGNAKEPEVCKVDNEEKATRRWVRRLIREAGGGEIRMCYEAGPNGFALKRRLEALGSKSVVVEVIAPTLTPRRVGRRVKTDPIDAKKLVLLFRAGELTEVAVPTETDESGRDLTRLYHRVGEELTRKKHHLLKFLVRRGRIYRERNWTGAHRKWLQSQQWESWADAVQFEELTIGLRELEDRRQRLEAALTRLSAEDRHQAAVGVLRCFHGMDTVAAVSLATEIFAIERFRSPRALMSYVGMVPTVTQSGESPGHRGSITKTGNRYARWVLGQVAWHARRKPAVGYRLKQRREGQPAWAIDIANRAQQRLHRRYWALVNRGVPSQRAVTAVARELLGFLWEALTETTVRSAKVDRAA